MMLSNILDRISNDEETRQFAIAALGNIVGAVVFAFIITYVIKRHA